MEEEIQSDISPERLPWYRREYYVRGPKGVENSRGLITAGLLSMATLAGSGLAFFPAQMTFIGSGATLLFAGSCTLTSAVLTMVLTSYRLVDTYRNMRDARNKSQRFDLDANTAELTIDLNTEFGEKTSFVAQYDFQKKRLRKWTSKRKLLALPLFFMGGVAPTTVTAVTGSVTTFGFGALGMKSYLFFHHLRQTLNDDKLFPDLNDAQRDLASHSLEIQPNSSIPLDPGQGIDVKLSEELRKAESTPHFLMRDNRQVYLEVDHGAAVIEIAHDGTSDEHCVSINAPGLDTIRLALSNSEYDHVFVSRPINGPIRLCASDSASPVPDGITRVFSVFSNNG